MLQLKTNDLICGVEEDCRFSVNPFIGDKMRDISMQKHFPSDLPTMNKSSSVVAWSDFTILLPLYHNSNTILVAEAAAIVLQVEKSPLNCSHLNTPLIRSSHKANLQKKVMYYTFSRSKIPRCFFTLCHVICNQENANVTKKWCLKMTFTNVQEMQS